MTSSFNFLQSARLQAEHDTNKFFVSELGGYLTKDWAKYVQLARNTPEINVFEEYWGIWSAIRKQFSSWKVDSVIHALGNTRQASSNWLDDAEMIISTKYSLSSDWQPWNLSQNYWFYDKLLKNWTPSDESPTTIVWRKNTYPLAFKNNNCSHESRSISLQVEGPGFYEVDLKYKVQGDGRLLALIQNNISYAMGSNGYVSIDPKGVSSKFPVYVKQTSGVSFQTKVIGNGSINVLSCTAKYISFHNSEVLAVPGSVPNTFFMSDVNWKNGIALHWAGFVVPNTKKSIDLYKVGSLVKFVNGEFREIISVIIGGNINIYLSGEKLDPEKVGFPNSFVVTEHHAALNITDVNWTKGVSKKWAGFVVLASLENMDRYKIGNKLKFTNGDIREITQVIKGGYINIYLNGESLDGEKVGYPNNIEVVK